MSHNVDKAAKLFERGFNCAQAVACGCGHGLGLDHDQLLTVAGAFGGGIGSTGRVCGAVSGAVMVIGLRCPRLDPKKPLPKQESTRLVRELIKKFEERNGSVNCKDLIGFDLGQPNEAKQAQESGAFKTKCPKFVQDAAEILEEL